MKKKLIEQVAYEYMDQKTTKKHTHMVAAQLIDKYILFDFYSNKENKWVPDVRCVIGPTEFENRIYSTGLWNKQRINYLLGEQRYYTGSTAYKKIVDSIEVSEKTLEMAAGYFESNDLHVSTYSRTLIDKMEQVETHIHWEYQARAEKRHFKKIQDKMEEIKELPKDFTKFLLEKAYKNNHYLYFSDEKAFCSRCGRELSAGEYKHNKEYRCPKCRRRVIAKNSRRMIAPKEERKEILIMQSHGEEIVLRYVKTLLYEDGEHKERLEYTESVRTYHQNDIGNFTKRYVHYYNNLVGGDYWDDKMSPYHQVGYGAKSILYTNNWEDLQTIVNPEWLDLMKYWSEEGIGMPLKSFLQSGKIRVEIIEKLFRAGLKRMSTEVARGVQKFDIAWYETELKKILKVSKPLLNWAQSQDVIGEKFAVLQDAFMNNYGLSDEEIIELASRKISPSLLKEVSKGNKLMKTLHYLQKASGYKDLDERLRHYRDYMSMALQLEYDLNNDTVRYPKDIKTAHDKATTEINIAEMDKKISDAIHKYPGISLKKKTINKEFGFRNKQYIIMAPVSAGDIIEEGKTLHHCVGGDNYLSKHNDGKTFILFMRKAEAPEERYYTIEIDPATLQIIQYFGAYDKKPDKEQVDKFLKKWKEYLMRKHYREKEAV